MFNRLFNKPKTLEEFMERAKKKGVREVHIRWVINDWDSLPLSDGLGSYSSYSIIEAKGLRLKLKKYTHDRLGLLYHTAIAIREIKRNTLMEAAEAAQKLMDCGFDVDINGGPVEVARQAISYYEKEIEELKKEQEASTAG